MYIIADFILIIHFTIIAFIIAGFFLIPIGYKLNLYWSVNKTLRITHFLLIGIVTTESFIGMTCPLTTVEKLLRNDFSDETFVNYWLSKIIYWDYPLYFFCIVYCLCFFWTFFLWKICPPKNTKS